MLLPVTQTSLLCQRPARQLLRGCFAAAFVLSLSLLLLPCILQSLSLNEVHVLDPTESVSPNFVERERADQAEQQPNNNDNAANNDDGSKRKPKLLSVKASRRQLSLSHFNSSGHADMFTDPPLEKAKFTDIINDCKMWNKRYGLRSFHADQAIARQREFRESPCGSLWLGRAEKQKIPPSGSRIQLVIAHCAHDLGWLDEVLQQMKEKYGYIVSVQVFSKCEKEEDLEHSVLTRADKAIVETLPNVGGCDHSYSHWLTKNHPTVTDDLEWDYVIFLKDTYHGEIHRILHMLWNAYNGDRDFGCGADPIAPFKKGKVDFTRMDGTKKEVRGFATYSALHSSEHLHQFNLASYKRRTVKLGLMNHTEEHDDQFASQYKNVLDFMSSALGLEGGWSTKLVNVCYGGNFAATPRGVQRTQVGVFERLEKALSRGNNIQEGHLTERLWASFFQAPLSEDEVEAITKNFMGGISFFSGQHGMLGRII